jgi:hypothetical protein
MLLKYVSSKYCSGGWWRGGSRPGQSAARSSQASYDELGLDSSAVDEYARCCALSWLPFYCGAVLSGLDDDHISLITPGEGVHVFSE